MDFVLWLLLGTLALGIGAAIVFGLFLAVGLVGAFVREAFAWLRR